MSVTITSWENDDSVVLVVVAHVRLQKEGVDPSPPRHRLQLP